MNEYKFGKDKGEIARLGFFFSILILIGYLLLIMPRVSIPLGLSYVLYLVLSPIVLKLKKLKVGNNTSVAIVMIGFAFFTIYPIVKLVPLLKEEAENLQFYIPKVEIWLRTNYQKLSSYLLDKYDIVLSEDYLMDGISFVTEKSKEIVFALPKNLASIAEIIFIVPLFLFFFLRDGREIKRMALMICPNKIFERFYYLFYQLNKNIGDYIFAKIVEASIIGVLITGGLLIIGVKFSLILGLIAAVTNIIPYLGPFLGMVPGIILAFTEYELSTTTGAICILYMVANAIDLALVFPILVSKIVNLHPIIVVVSVIIGSHYLGIAGMIISIPVAAALKLLFLEIYKEFYGSRLKN